MSKRGPAHLGWTPFLYFAPLNMGLEMSVFEITGHNWLFMACLIGTALRHFRVLISALRIISAVSLLAGFDKPALDEYNPLYIKDDPPRMRA